MPTIIDVQHPDHTAGDIEWAKWRLTYEGGPAFRKKYLKKFSAREEKPDFDRREAVTYVPAFAKAAVNDIKNSIFQRIADVTRVAGPASYQRAVEGKGLGVDNKGSSMNSFIGRQILPELLPMKRVGVYVDREKLPAGTTKADEVGSPYLYVYKTEDIRSWVPMNNGEPSEMRALLLRDKKFKSFGDTPLPDSEIIETYRFYWIDQDGKVNLKVYNDKGEQDGDTIQLDISVIPFTMFELTESLLKDVADYQISLMNLSSSDIGYCLMANFPFYTEQRDPQSMSSHLKRSQNAGTEVDSDGVPEEGATDDEVRAGATHGRAYRKGLDRPGFIAPPTDPLMMSMKKQAEMKGEIRELVNLALSNVKPKMASAESKGMDERGLESGLSYIGLELEHGERQIAKFWALYESEEPATIEYPKRYSLKSDSEIMDEAEKLEKRMSASPSLTYKREIAKQIVSLMLNGKVSAATVKKIHGEIDKAEILVTDPDTVAMLVENAILDNKGAAQAFTIPEDRVEKAQEDHANRAKRIAEAQAKAAPAARGVDDLDPDPNSGKKEKQAAGDSTLDPDGGDKTRGDAK